MASRRGVDFLAARNNWVGWVRFYLATHPGEIPTRTELARRLRVVKSALTPLLDPAGTRSPSFETLLASAEVLDMPLDTLVKWSPPPAPATQAAAHLLAPPAAKRGGR